MRHRPSGKQRVVWHLRYTDWPDQGCPANHHNFLGMWQLLNYLFIQFVNKTVSGGDISRCHNLQSCCNSEWCRRRRRFWHATLRLHSAIRRHHPPQRVALSQICCFGERKVVCFRSCWTMLSHVMRGRPGCLLLSAGGEANRILLASALSSMRIIRVSRRDWIIAVSLGFFVSLRTSSFRTNWYHLMPSSIHRHHWSSASILRASVLDIAQQSEPYRNIGKIHVLYSFNFVEMASRDLQI